MEERAEKINEPAWMKIVEPSNQVRKDHASILYRNYIISFGGVTSEPLGDVVAFQTDLKIWVNAGFSQTKPTPRFAHSLCLIQNNSALVFGGKLKDGFPTNELGLMIIEEQKDCILIEWKVITCTNGEGPKRSYHTAHIYENHMYIFGGNNDVNVTINELNSLNLKSYNTDTFAWEQCKPLGNLPPERDAHSSVLYRGKIYVFGGYSPYKGSKLNDLWVLDIRKLILKWNLSVLELMEWQQLQATGDIPIPRCAAPAVEISGHIYIFGGYTNNATDLNDLYSYSICKKLEYLSNNSLVHNNWVQVKAQGEAPFSRRYATMVPHGESFFLFGGYGQEGFDPNIYVLYIKKKIVIPPKEKTITGDVAHFSLKDAFLDKAFSDLILEVEDQEIPAHKLVLALRSKFFSNMFSSGMMESTCNKIQIPGVKAHVFKEFLRFIYYDNIKIDEDLACELLQLSDKYLMPDLRQEVEIFLAEQLTPDNFAKIAKLADMHGTETLNKAISFYGFENLELLQKREDFKDIPN